MKKGGRHSKSWQRRGRLKRRKEEWWREEEKDAGEKDERGWEKSEGRSGRELKVG